MGAQENDEPRRPAARRRVRAAGALALLLLAALVAAVLVQRGRSVQALTVQRQDIVQSVVSTGRVIASARMGIASEVAATVREVRVREGDAVRAGQVLARLADEEARAALAQAQAGLAEAQSRAVQQSRVGAAVADEAELQARAALRAAEREHERVSQLVAQGFFAPQRLDEARRAFEVARSALASAQAQSQAHRPQGVEPQLAADRVAQARATVQLAQARLARLELRAPVDALVLRRDAEPGLMAQPGRELLVLAGRGPLRIEASIDERHLPLLFIGMGARAVADAFASQPFDARLSELAPLVDAERGSVWVRLSIAQPPPFLKADMTVSVELFGGKRAQALVLPAEAVRDASRDQPWVLALREGRAVRVPVRLGLQGVGSVEITQGLTEGEQVIPQTEKALPGERVRAAPARAAQRGFELPSFMR
jgi:HlyD family secretion protein